MTKLTIPEWGVYSGLSTIPDVIRRLFTKDNAGRKAEDRMKQSSS